LRMVAITFHPLLAKNIAVALPIPAEAPVIKIVFVIFYILIESNLRYYHKYHVAKSEYVVAKMIRRVEAVAGLLVYRSLKSLTLSFEPY